MLRSDEVRKQLAGLDPLADATAAAHEGLYSPETTDRTYATLLDRAAERLSLGESVILDATWTSPRHRDDAARTAEATSSDLVALQCHVPVEVAEQRVAGRRGDASDATPAIARRLAEHAAGWPDAVRIDTTGDPHAVVEAALEHVGPVTVGEVTGWLER